MKQHLKESYILLGYPGSGKTTFLNNLKHRLHFNNIEIGNINRTIYSQQYPIELYQKIKSQYDNKGDRDPKIIFNTIDRYINSSKQYKSGYIIDGLKNSTEILMCIEHFRDTYGININNIIILYIDIKTAIQRLNQRSDNRIYNSSYKTIFDYRFKKMKHTIQEIQKNKRFTKNNQIIINTKSLNEQDVVQFFITHMLNSSPEHN